MLGKIQSRFLSMVRNFKIVYKDKDRKSLYNIIKEFIVVSIKSKSIATYYFTSFLYKRNTSSYLDYISTKEWKFNQRAIADEYTKSITGDKLYFHYYFEKLNLPLPRLLAYNIKEKIIVKDLNSWISYEITSHESFLYIMKNLLDNSSSKSFFMKPTVGSEGHHILKIDKNYLEKNLENIFSIFRVFISRSFIFQEEVKQHYDLDALNPTTLNTIRIDTFKEFGKKPEVIGAMLRTGRIKSFIDNTAAGGCYTGINLDSGCLKNRGITKFAHGGLFYLNHPDSGIKFEGYKIPFFKEVKELAIDAANSFPQCLIGWDIAISEQGPVLMEGNTVYYEKGLDIANEGYRKNPIYNKVTDYVKNVLKK